MLRKPRLQRGFFNVNDDTCKVIFLTYKSFHFLDGYDSMNANNCSSNVLDWTHT